jgi:hypothetical protein
MVIVRPVLLEGYFLKYFLFKNILKYFFLKKFIFDLDKSKQYKKIKKTI